VIMKYAALKLSLFKDHFSCRLVMILFPAFLFNVSVYATAIELLFKDSVSVNDTIITFGDIASVRSRDSGAAEKIRQTTAGVSAPAGFSRFVSAEDAVIFRLKPLFRNAQISIHGSRRVSVFTNYTKMSISDYREDIIEYIKSNLSWPQQCFSVTILNTEHSWNVLNQPFDVSLRGLADCYAKGNIQIELIARQGNRTYRIPVRCKINVSIPVIVACRQIKRGKIVEVEDCEFQKMDITGFGPTPLSSIEDIKNMQALRTIEPGTVIHDRLLKQKPIIEKGDRVIICSESASVRVYVSAVARESGNTGEKIWVQNENSNRLIRVTVLDNGKVAISKGGDAT